MTDPGLLAAMAAARQKLPHWRVIPFDWQGNRYWLKNSGVEDPAKFLRRLQAWLSPLLPDMLKAAPVPSVRILLAREKARAEDWMSRGLPGPKLLAGDDDWLLFADGGDTLRTVVAVSPQKEALLLRAFDTLLAVHRAGVCHGRPMLKDMAVDAGGNITLLDLEENPVDVMPLLTAQARDLLIFLSSLEHADDETVKKLTAKVVDSPAAAEISAVMGRLQLLYRLCRLLRLDRVSGDMENAMKLYRLLRRERL